jgi:hypothetical protein
VVCLLKHHYNKQVNSIKNVNQVREEDTTIDDENEILHSINVGNHLKTCMEKDYFKNLNDNYYVLLTVRVIKTLKGPMGLFDIIDAKVDIDGGKCHLGETSVACAKRE